MPVDARIVARAAGALAGALLAGCQWVLPLHEDSAGDADGASLAPLAAPPDGAPSPSVDDAAPADEDAAAPPDAAPTRDAAPDDDAAISCTEHYSYVDVCDDCLNAHCCAEMFQCFFRNPECSAIQDCIAQCGFDFIQCPQKCFNDHPAGTSDYNKANMCWQGQCHAVCNQAHDAGGA